MPSPMPAEGQTAVGATAAVARPPPCPAPGRKGRRRGGDPHTWGRSPMGVAGSSGWGVTVLDDRDPLQPDSCALGRMRTSPSSRLHAVLTPFAGFIFSFHFWLPGKPRVLKSPLLQVFSPSGRRLPQNPSLVPPRT